MKSTAGYRQGYAFKKQSKAATAKGMRMRLKTTFICVYSPVSTVQVATAKAHFDGASLLASAMQSANKKKRTRGKF